MSGAVSSLRTLYSDTHTRTWFCSIRPKQRFQEHRMIYNEGTLQQEQCEMRRRHLYNLKTGCLRSQRTTLPPAARGSCDRHRYESPVTVAAAIGLTLGGMFRHPKLPPQHQGDRPGGHASTT